MEKQVTPEEQRRNRLKVQVENNRRTAQEYRLPGKATKAADPEQVPTVKFKERVEHDTPAEVISITRKKKEK